MVFFLFLFISAVLCGFFVAPYKETRARFKMAVAILACGALLVLVLPMLLDFVDVFSGASKADEGLIIPGPSQIHPESEYQKNHDNALLQFELMALLVIPYLGFKMGLFIRECCKW